MVGLDDLSGLFPTLMKLLWRQKGQQHRFNAVYKREVNEREKLNRCLLTTYVQQQAVLLKAATGRGTVAFSPLSVGAWGLRQRSSPK